jgi:ABC-type Zn2+ transport system substrate-binding protein/surface adhesin
MRLKSAWTLAVFVFAALATPISPAATRTLAQSTPKPALQRCQPSARLVVLDQAICDSIASIPEGVHKLLIYHDSFAYFAPRYGIQVIGAIQPSDFTEPSAQEVARLIEQIKAAGVPAFFGSAVFPSRVLNQIGKEAGVKYIETLADDTLPNQVGNRLYHSYLQLMANDVTTIVRALGGDPSPLKAVPTDNLNGPDTAVESSAP